MKSKNDRLMLMLWRRAVLKKHYGMCFLCGRSVYEIGSKLECHHFFHRSNFLLRYDWRNGVLACGLVNPQYKMTCHQYADTPEGKEKVKQRLDFEAIYNISLMDKKDALTSLGETDDEFMESQKKELVRILSE